MSGQERHDVECVLCMHRRQVRVHAREGHRIDVVKLQPKHGQPALLQLDGFLIGVGDGHEQCGERRAHPGGLRLAHEK